MPEIKILEKHVAELIAAGEVVERPASVVKELMENSIDAGSTSITVEIKRGGVTYIRITDNGCGIDRNNIKKAFISHATSKISAADDLNSIMTLGFRGEALASVAAVARVEIMTKACTEEVGTRYCIEGGEEVLLDDAGCPKGTTIIVRDIFYNTPARMKFLKKDVTEGNAVAGIVDRIALSHPEISVRLIRDGNETLVTSGDGVIKNTIYSVFGKDFSQTLIPCGYEYEGIKISGFVSKPVNARPNRTMQFFFLNGRLVKTRTGGAALEAAYKNTTMVGKYPACVMNISIPAGAVDINVHPAKTEVRFADEKRVFDAVYYGTKLALKQNDTIPEMSFESKAQIKVNAGRLPQAEKGTQLKFSPVQPEKSDYEKSFFNNISLREVNEEKTEDKKDSGFTFESAGSVSDYSKVREDDDILLNNPSSPEKKFADNSKAVSREIEISEDKESGSLTGDDIKIIGEAFKTYIFVESNGKIIIIDKHAAHERMIFESLKKDSESSERQILMSPVTVTLSKEEYGAVIENLSLLEKAGYLTEDFGQGSVIVTECPMYLEAGDIEDEVRELAGYLSQNRRELVTEKLDWIYHSTACRAAIKAGDKTSDYELEKFAASVLSNPDIRYCPHGRPVLMEMTKKELERKFGRLQ